VGHVSVDVDLKVADRRNLLHVHAANADWIMGSDVVDIMMNTRGHWSWHESAAAD